MMETHTGGQDPTGKSMAEMAEFLNRRSVDAELEFSLTKSELWALISRSGNLNECHPFCRQNDPIEWHENSHIDRLEYLNGLTYIRQFLNWNEESGYDLVIGEKDGPQSYVVWKITELDSGKCRLSITVYPYLLANINKAISLLPFVFYIRPKLRNYLKSVLRGFVFYADNNQPVPRNHWGRHSWFS